jgi:hypothetical protein
MLQLCQVITFFFASSCTPKCIITRIEKIGIPTGNKIMHATAHILVNDVAVGQGSLTSEGVTSKNLMFCIKEQLVSKNLLQEAPNPQAGN